MIPSSRSYPILNTVCFYYVKTSNPGASDFQDLLLDEILPSKEGRVGLLLYEKVAQMAQEWNTHDNLGLVVGATQPEALRRVREIAPDLWILTPGVGIQGGDLTAALQAGLRPDGLGMLIPISRGISRSNDPWRAAEEIRQNINEGRRRIHSLDRSNTQAKIIPSSSNPFSQLANGLLEEQYQVWGIHLEIWVNLADLYRSQAAYLISHVA